MNRSTFQFVGTQFGMVAFTYKDKLNLVNPYALNMVCVQEHSDRSVVLLGVDMYSNGTRRAQVFNFDTMTQAMKFAEDIIYECGEEEFGTAFANTDIYHIRRDAVSMIREEIKHGQNSLLIGIEGTMMQRISFDTKSESSEFLTSIMSE